MVTNPNSFSQQGTGNTLNQIVDGADFPHTGLIKSLSQVEYKEIMLLAGSILLWVVILRELLLME